MTTQEFLFKTIEQGSVLLAHALYIGIQQGCFSAMDPVDKINLDDVPKELVIQATTENRLNIKVTKLFALYRPLEQDFAYYLAYDADSAAEKHYELFGEPPAKVFDQSDKMHTSIVGVDEPLRKAKTFFDYKKGATLPRYIGLFEARKY